jgi:hypothetical protein
MHGGGARTEPFVEVDRNASPLLPRTAAAAILAIYEAWHWRRIINCQSPIANCQWPIANRRSPIPDQIANRQSDRQSSIPNRQCNLQSAICNRQSVALT